MFNDREARQIASAICTAAKNITDTLEKMIGELPPGASPEMAMQCLALELSDSQPLLAKALLQTEARTRLPMTRVSAPESLGATNSPVR